MATTGCASAGSSTLSPMKQLHALHPVACRSPLSTTLPQPCKLVFLFYLPTRLNPITSTRHRLSFSPPFCGHGELEIVSVKELADGFLHFSFGAAPSGGKVGDLSSSCGEHLAGKLSVPRRLPSKFSKKSPIPVAAVRQRRRQEEGSSKENTAKAIPLSVKVSVNQLSRPKSVFVKRSPISKSNGEHILLKGKESNGTVVHGKSMIPQGTKTGSMKVSESMRPTSVFVRKSPIPASAGKLNNGHVMPLANSDSSPLKMSNAAPTASSLSRPKSNFFRKSPIVKVQRLSPTRVTTTTRQSLLTPSSHEASANAEANAKSQNMPASSVSRPKSNFFRKSPIVKVQRLSPTRVTTTTRQSLLTPSSHEASANAEANAESQNMPKESLYHTIDLEKCKLAELKNLAKIKGVKGYYKLKKAELLDLLKKLDS